MDSTNVKATKYGLVSGTGVVVGVSLIVTMRTVRLDAAIEGRTLREWLKGRTHDPPEWRRTMPALADALDLAHSAGQKWRQAGARRGIERR